MGLPSVPLVWAVDKRRCGLLSRTRAGCHIPSRSLSHAVLSVVFLLEPGALQMFVMGW